MFANVAACSCNQDTVCYVVIQQEDHDTEQHSSQQGYICEIPNNCLPLTHPEPSVQDYTLEGKGPQQTAVMLAVSLEGNPAEMACRLSKSSVPCWGIARNTSLKAQGGRQPDADPPRRNVVSAALTSFLTLHPARFPSAI